MVDVAVTVVLLVVGVMLGVTEFYYLGARPGDVLPPEPPTLPRMAAIVAIITPLVWRRRVPLTVLMLVTGAHVTALAVLGGENEITGLAVLLALYSACAYGAKPWRTVLWAAAMAAITAAYTYPIAVNQSVLAGAVFSVHLVVLGVAANVLAYSVRVGRDREAELKIRTAQLAAERETNARRAVLDERVRVARELHDVIAHHVSLMGIQAAAARRVLTTRPDQAANALAAIEGSSRQTVGELHRMLGFLRQDNEDDLLAPQPSLRRLDDLLTQLSDVKLTVEVHIEGDQQPLPASVDLSAYRIVQEALTNTLKHAEATAAAVRLRYQSGAFEVEVVDNGVGTTSTAHAGNGRECHGLIGMRERVILHRGQFEAGPRPEGGFGVLARFPLGGQT